MTELPQERLLVGEMSLASAEACYEWTRTWCKVRTQIDIYKYKPTNNRYNDQ